MDIGESCAVNEQCRGTANSTVCENSTCTCSEGYISLGEQCYEGEIKNTQYKSKTVNELNGGIIFLQKYNVSLDT